MELRRDGVLLSGEGELEDASGMETGIADAEGSKFTSGMTVHFVRLLPRERFRRREEGERGRSVSG